MYLTLVNILFCLFFVSCFIRLIFSNVINLKWANFRREVVVAAVDLREDAVGVEDFVVRREAGVVDWEEAEVDFLL